MKNKANIIRQTREDVLQNKHGSLWKTFDLLFGNMLHKAYHFHGTTISDRMSEYTTKAYSYRHSRSLKLVLLQTKITVVRRCKPDVNLTFEQFIKYKTRYSNEIFYIKH